MRTIIAVSLACALLLPRTGIAQGPGEGADEARFKDLRQKLLDPNPKVRQAAARALGKIALAMKFTVTNVSWALEDTDPAVRAEAAQTLGFMGPAAVVAAPRLLKALGNSTVRVHFCKGAARGHGPGLGRGGGNLPVRWSQW
jgi:hypothetical protein